MSVLSEHWSTHSNTLIASLDQSPQCAWILTYNVFGLLNRKTRKMKFGRSSKAIYIFKERWNHLCWTPCSVAYVLLYSLHMWSVKPFERITGIESYTNKMCMTWPAYQVRHQTRAGPTPAAWQTQTSRRLHLFVFPSWKTQRFDGRWPSTETFPTATRRPPIQRRLWRGCWTSLTSSST